MRHLPLPSHPADEFAPDGGMSPLDEPCDPCGDVSYGVVGVLLAVMLGGSALALLAARLLW